jgi:hypothetical protein
MRSAGNFSPEWGYLAPAPSFMRTARIVVVATAVGATAGAIVMLSLVDHPATQVSSDTAAAAHAIVTSAQAATPLAIIIPRTANIAAPVQAQIPLQTPAPVNPQPAVATQSPQAPAIGVQAPYPGAANLSPAPQSPPSVAALTEGTPATDMTPAATPDDAAATPLEAPPPKKTTKHNGQTTANGNGKPNPSLGGVLRRLFTTHSGPSYYPNR